MISIPVNRIMSAMVFGILNSNATGFISVCQSSSTAPRAIKGIKFDDQIAGDDWFVLDCCPCRR